MPPPSPTVASWELALRLKQRREQLGVEVKRITDVLSFTRNYWSAVENHRTVLSAEKLATLLGLLEFDEDEQRELMALRDTAKQRGWWASYSALFNAEALRFFGLEYGALAIRCYESLMLPGLLQTDDYARAIMAADISVRKVEIEPRIEVRRQRRSRLYGDDPLLLTVIVSEAALQQQIGGYSVLRDQLRDLVRTIEQNQDTIVFRVVPFTAQSCGLFGASTMSLIDFVSPRLPVLGWQESVTMSQVIENTGELRHLSLVFDEALDAALDSKDSLALIEEAARAMETWATRK